MSETTPLSSESTRTLWLTVLVYGLMALATYFIFQLILWQGASLVAPAPAAGEAGMVAEAAAKGGSFLSVLIAMAAILITGQVMAHIFAYLRQPPVIGQVIGGILLGPSLLGPELSHLILPPEIAPQLGVIAQLGVVLYMFLVGLELNPSLLRHRASATVATSHASILAPFILGALLALYLYPRLSNSQVPFVSFALFMGVAMSITAFPVLARILADAGLSHTRIGAMALGCAAVDDVTAWCLLAFVVGVAKAQAGAGLLVTAGALAFIVVMLRWGRPVLAAIARSGEGQTHPRSAITLVFIALLLSTLTAEAIGIHALFGAFLLGALMPHQSSVARLLTQQLDNVVTILLLPAFFAFTGMRTRIDLLSEPGHWLICGLIVVTAIAGKFGGTLVAARCTGLPWRESAILGALMNTRGLMELIVLNVGLDLQIISPTLFGMMVIMALATTLLTAPVLALLKPPTPEEEAEWAASMGEGGGPGVGEPVAGKATAAKTGP